MMSGRFWFYLAVLIVGAGELSLLVGGRARLNNELSRLNQAAFEEQEAALKPYLARQTDERKLVSLAKRLKQGDQRLLQLIIERAYELNPNSRDIALLASYFHPELKEKVKELDPLYSSQ